MLLWEEEKKRKPFSTKIKKIEWMLAAGRRVYDKSGKLRFVSTSKCRACGTPLKWGDRRYNFDHKDNNPLNNSQTNCYLVCRNCHGKHTVLKKRAVRGMLGETVGYKTIKKKVGYKKSKERPKPKETRRVAIRDIFDNVVGYKTVKVRQTKTATKKATPKKTGRKSKSKTTTRKKSEKKRATSTRRKKKSS